MACPDCGIDYTDTEQEHWRECEAHYCVMCLNTYPQVVPERLDGKRICRACQADLDAGEFDPDAQEDMEGEN